MKDSIKKEIVKFGKLLYERNLNAAYGGNLSVRKGNKIYITPSGFNKAFLKEEDVLLTDLEGDLLEKPVKPLKPSSESKMHYAIYKARPDVRAIIHSHPAYCIALAIANEPLKHVLPETTIVLGKIGFTSYVTPGGWDLGNSVAASFKEGDACIMGNHGATTVGKDLFEAFNKLELLESTAKSFLLAKLLGKVNELPNGDIHAFLKMYKNLS